MGEAGRGIEAWREGEDGGVGEPSESESFPAKSAKVADIENTKAAVKSALNLQSQPAKLPICQSPILRIVFQEKSELLQPDS